ELDQACEYGQVGVAHEVTWGGARSSSVPAGPWPELTEARGWARHMNTTDLARVRFTVPLVPARELEAVLIYHQRERDESALTHKRETDWGYSTARCAAPTAQHFTDDWNAVTCPACRALADPPR